MCTSSCLTQDHASWGECVRSKNLRVAWANSANGLDLSREKKWDKRLADYKTAREQGIQPDSTKPGDVRKAVELSEKTGEPYKAA